MSSSHSKKQIFLSPGEINSTNHACSEKYPYICKYNCKYNKHGPVVMPFWPVVVLIKNQQQ